MHLCTARQGPIYLRPSPTPHPHQQLSNLHIHLPFSSPHRTNLHTPHTQRLRLPHPTRRINPTPPRRRPNRRHRTHRPRRRYGDRYILRTTWDSVVGYPGDVNAFCYVVVGGGYDLCFHVSFAVVIVGGKWGGRRTGRYVPR